tara:strand:- start:17 stop:739 length:723 start_codon:yes stop_codon:yes gene_type:complete
MISANVSAFSIGKAVGRRAVPSGPMSWQYSGTSFSTTSQEISPTGITWDGTYFWVVGHQNKTAYKYNSSGVYQGVSFSVAAQSAYPHGIVWDGTNFWMVSGVQLHKYTAAGAFVSTYNLSNGGYVTGITWDGAFLWLVNQTSDAVYKYNTSGVYQGVSFSVASQDTSPKGVTWDGTYFWMVGDVTNSVYKYNASGTYQGVSFSAYAQATSAQDLVSVGTDLWVTDYSSDAVYKYSYLPTP